MVSAPVAAQVAEVRLGTSFDCARIGAGPSVPSLVCQTPELQLADVHQMQAYYALRHAQPERQQELRDQFNARIQGLVRECSTEQRRASGSQPSCVVRAFGDLHSFWFQQLQQTGNAAAVEEARHPASHFVGAQHALKAAGFLSSDASVDGVFGSGSRQAIARFQSGRGIPATGFLTSATADALMSLSAEQTRASATTRQPGTGSASANPPMVLVQGSQAPSGSAEIHAVVQRHFIDAFARCWRLDQGLPDHNIEILIVLDTSAIGREVRPSSQDVSRSVQQTLYELANPRIVREVRPPRQGVPRDPVGRSLYEQARRALLDPRCYQSGINLLLPSHVVVFSMYFNRQGLTGIENFVERMTDGERAEYGRRVARAEAEANQRARQQELDEQERRGIEEARRNQEAARRSQEDERRRNEVRAARDEHMRNLEQLERRHAEATTQLRLYRGRSKNILEEIMNYTFFAREDGDISEGDAQFWVSGYGGAHRCVMTLMTVTSQFSVLRSSLSSLRGDDVVGWTVFGGMMTGLVDWQVIDLREFNEQGFQIRQDRDASGSYFTLGDERQRIRGSGSAVMERLRRAWGLAFQECPGRRSRF